MVNEHKNAVKLVINLTKKEIEYIDSLVDDNEFLNRTDFVRSLIRMYKYKNGGKENE